MQNLNELNARIKGINETRQITKAMQLISASKFKKAMIKCQSNQKHYNVLRYTIKDILGHSENIKHRYFEKRAGNRKAFIVISADKGLAGDYNKKVLNLAYSEINKVDEKYIFIVGNMASEFFKSKKIDVDIEFLNIAQNPSLNDALKMTKDILNLFDQNVLDEIDIVYTMMDSKGKHKPVCAKLLPFNLEDFKGVKDIDEDNLMDTFTFEPSPQSVFDIITPQYIIGIIYGALMQSIASEHFERMVAMKSALDNSNAILYKLSLKKNKLRQEKITNELLEITAGSVYK